MTSCTPLTPEERALLQARLKQAEDAYHRLSVGGAIREIVDQNGERVSYTQTSKSGLYSYIVDLRLQLGLAPTRSPTGGAPIRFVF